MNNLSHVLKKGMKGYFSVIFSYAMLGVVWLIVSFMFIIVGLLVPRIITTLLFWGFIILFAYIVSLGMAYIVSQAISKENVRFSGVFSVFKRKFIPKNVMYLFIRFAVFLAVFLIASVGVQMLAESIITNFGWTTLIILAFLALLPVMIVAMLLSMVPYLLADPDFNQMENNPLFLSMKMVKGHYITVFLLRFIFFLWYAWIFVGGLIFILFTIEEVSVYVYGFPPITDWGSLAPIMNDEVLRERIFGVLGYSILVTPLIIPLYRVIHGVLYAKLKYETKEQGLKE